MVYLHSTLRLCFFTRLIYITMPLDPPTSVILRGIQQKKYKIRIIGSQLSYRKWRTLSALVTTWLCSCRLFFVLREKVVNMLNIEPEDSVVSTDVNFPFLMRKKALVPLRMQHASPPLDNVDFVSHFKRNNKWLW